MLRTTAVCCSLCGSPTTEKVLADRIIRRLPENQMFDGRLRIVECRKCGLRYLNPRPDLRDLPHIYDYDVYEDSTNNNSVLQEYFYAMLSAHCRPLRRVLEIGCGTGQFLAFLESKGLEVTGVEFADSAERVKFKGQLLVGRIEDIEVPDKFDAVLLLNVIEHLADPMAVLRKIRSILSPGGVLLLRHPNSDLFHNLPYKLSVEIPKFLIHRVLHHRGKKTKFTLVGFQNQHLHYLNRTTATDMLQLAGFAVSRYSTEDPYNRQRIGRALRSGRVLEAIVASVRHALSSVGLGPECLILARAGGAPASA